ncbi:hypothetical protein FA95DRAFT_1566124 [Auriscalpium vulgare]|uniref:Uncharacterized protein n=1 Tax=Auriscalpium vulgare TaxID=40419 RepID=A0ACB8RA32_9AGAM|nr:hypothetical protein FA95DRAFT_1566124 [Auriscalpium vulgare]
MPAASPYDPPWTAPAQYFPPQQATHQASRTQLTQPAGLPPYSPSARTHSSSNIPKIRARRPRLR